MSKIWLEMKLDPAAVAMLAEAGDLIGPGADGLAGDPQTGIDQADAVIAGPKVAWNRAAYERAPRVQVVARTGIGYDNVDVAAATAAGVCATNTPDAPTESTAEFTIAAMLALGRKLALADRRFRAEGWIPTPELVGVEFDGKTLGLVGLGRIGSRVAEIALALRMKVLAYDPHLSSDAMRAKGLTPAADLTALFSASDVVSLHLPLTPQTRGSIGEAAFAGMKKGALLINAARGPIIVEAALVAALKSGHLGGAAVDVWDPEPAEKGNPLLRLDNVLATPHIASSTVDGRRRLQVGAAECALAVLAGRVPPGLLNPGVWEKRRR